MSAKLASRSDLLPRHRSLLLGQKPRPGLASHGLSQAVIRTVASLGVVGASAARLTTPNRAIGYRAPAHGLGVGQLVGELTDAGGDFRRDGHAHILRHILT